MSTDPRQIIANAPMSRLQVIIIGITIALNALDGFDVMSISFASPGIATEWGIDRAALGLVLSMELIGMALGSIALGGVADRLGRRPTIVGCLILMTAGMIMAPTATSLNALSAWRVLTGLGIGGMLAAINAVAAEFSSAKRKHLSVSLMSIGYPVGAVLGGLVAQQLLKVYDWRSVFYFGAAVTAVLIPVVLMMVPESVDWLTRKQPAGALDRINASLARMGHATVKALPTLTADVKKGSITDIFAPALVATTAIVTAAYFFHITTFYFIVKWVPKIVADFGFQPASAAGVLVWVNVGGATGGAIFGLLTQKFSVKMLTIGVLVLSTVAVTVFGRTPPDLQQLSMICLIAGFCTNAGIVGLYALVAQAFPTHVRAFGTGFTIGVGRGGAALAPVIAGYLFNFGYPLSTVAVTMAIGSLIGAAVLTLLRIDSDRTVGIPVPQPGPAR